MECNNNPLVIKQLDDYFTYVEYNNKNLIIMKNNGYVNCSKLCKSVNKYFSRWKRLSTSKAILEVKKQDNDDNIIISVHGKGTMLSIMGFYVRQDIVQYVSEWLGGNTFVDEITEIINLYNLFYNEKKFKPLVVCKCKDDILCPFSKLGRCYYGKRCKYMHGNKCNICDLYLLHPTDYIQRNNHLMNCTESRKLLPPFVRSINKKCNICLENIYDKEIDKQYFGILSNCKHVFCLYCIQRWMLTIKGTDTEDTCPVCRTVSTLVVPCRYWIEDNYEKRLIINKYKKDNLITCKTIKRFITIRDFLLFTSDDRFFITSY
ncbi:SWPV1-181 [Shearwaterpox virus]|uniref:SWPV1-181 n=1 Tax=Shearwaterpox virus TaxID=1974596 RepID=A0A1V0S7Z9_CNPV|nr:SWPV1-181 [Shearwaterpox virus]